MDQPCCTCTNEHSGGELKTQKWKFYNKLQETLNATQIKDTTLLMGNWNAKAENWKNLESK